MPCSWSWAIWSPAAGEYLRLFLYAIALPYLANTAGWLLTEIGRYPWIVYGLMTHRKCRLAHRFGRAWC